MKYLVHILEGDISRLIEIEAESFEYIANHFEEFNETEFAIDILEWSLEEIEIFPISEKYRLDLNKLRQDERDRRAEYAERRDRALYEALKIKYGNSDD